MTSGMGNWMNGQNTLRNVLRMGMGMIPGAGAMAVGGATAPLGPEIAIPAATLTGYGLSRPVHGLSAAMGLEPKMGQQQATNRAATEGALSGLGQSSTELLRFLGPLLSKAVLTTSLQPSRAMLQESPEAIGEISRQGWKAGLPSGQFGTAGATGSKTAMTARGMNTDALLQQATAAGHTLDPQTVLAPRIGKFLQEASRGGDPIGDTKRITQLWDQYMTQNNGPVTPLIAKELKDGAAAGAQGLYKGAAKGKMTTIADPILDRFNKEIADGWREGLATIPKYGKAIDAAEKSTSRAIQANQLLRHGETAPTASLIGLRLGLPLAAGAAGAIPGGSPQERARRSLAALVATATLTNPMLGTRAAAALSNPAMPSALTALPRLMAPNMIPTPDSTQTP